MRTTFRAGLSVALLLAAALFSLTLADAPASATTFAPTGGAEVTDTSAGANSDVTFDFHFTAPDALFTGVISFLPPEWGIGNCPANDVASASADCAGDSIPVGEILGENISASVLGLLNGACATQVPFDFTMVNATLDTNSTVVFHDTDDNGIGQMFEDKDENDIPDGVEKWPEFITRLIRTEPYPNGEAIDPLMRIYGQFNLSGTFVGLQYVFLEPGTPINGTPLDASLGYPIVLLLQDIGDPGATREPDPLTDFCSPLDSELTIFGMTDGNIATAPAGLDMETVLTNPADGGYNLVSFAASEYDDDGDGIPNPLDPCATQGNTQGWDPRSGTTTGDDDADGLPVVCDPDPDTFNQDQDGDGWFNRDDNCPLDANADQSDLDRDSIGDVCDATPVEPSLHQHYICLITEVDIGTGGDPASDPTVVPPCVLMVLYGILRGNVDCSEDGITPVDALHILRYDAGLWPAPPCIDGADVNCDGDRDTLDVLGVLRFDAGLEVAQQDPCTPVGTLIPVITY